MSLFSMCSVQIGAGIARGLFDRVPPASVVMLRQGGAAAVLIAVLRPAIRGRSPSEWRQTVGFGLVFAGMNLTFYAAIARLPLGVAVTIELLGPLGVAVARSRRRSEFFAVGLALSGVLLLAKGGSGIRATGVLFALLAASGWATYIVLSQRAGSQGAGFERLAMALAVAALCTAPLGLRAGPTLLEPHVLWVGAVVAMLSALVPFTLDMAALRLMPQRLFGLLQSLSPVFAVLAGWLTLGQRVTGVEAVGMLLVVAAAILSVARQSDDAIAASVDGDLSTRRRRERVTAQFRHDTRDSG